VSVSEKLTYGFSAGSEQLRKTLPRDFAQHVHPPEILLGAQCERAPIKLVNRRSLRLSCQRTGEPLDQNGCERHPLSHLRFASTNISDYYTFVHIISGHLYIGFAGSLDLRMAAARA
jgi:hypothetical protein